MPYHEVPEESGGLLHEVRIFFEALVLVAIAGLVIAVVMFTAAEAGEQILKALSQLAP